MSISIGGKSDNNASVFKIINACNSITGWTVLNADTENLATTSNHIFDSAAITFDKANNDADSTSAGAQRTTSLNLTSYVDNYILCWHCYILDTSNVDYAFLRLGTDSSNYFEYRFDDSSLVSTKWVRCHAGLDEPYVTGNGGDLSNIQWLAVGVTMSSESDTLQNTAIDRIELVNTSSMEIALNVE